jgi:enoyl-CoA hydratase/carnithine racemase
VSLRFSSVVHRSLSVDEEGMVTYETLLVSRDRGVVRITLNRPEKKNAINAVMWEELGAAVCEVGRRSDDRVLVLAGAGGAFCSGVDLTPSSSENRHPLGQMDHVNSVALALHHLSKPVVACVDGDAVGAGCNLALGCDIAVASSRSRFAEIFVRRGLAVDFGGSWILPRLVGLHRAKALCLTGDLVSARDAEAMGLIYRAVEASELDAVVQELVDRLLIGAPVAQTLTKRLLNNGGLSTIEQALDAEATAQVVNIGSSDGDEARDAFSARREPKFTGQWKM